MADEYPGRLILDYDGYTPCTESGECFCRMPSPEDNQRPEDIANARRLIAAWNACRGISIQDLETIAAHIGGDASRLSWLSWRAGYECRKLRVKVVSDDR